jgi:hypothetical protein
VTATAPVSHPCSTYLRSRTNVDHSVIAFENQIVHDPSLNNSGIIAPCDDGFIWVTFIVAGVTVK